LKTGTRIPSLGLLSEPAMALIASTLAATGSGAEPK